jgi:arylsulfatase
VFVYLNCARKSRLMESEISRRHFIGAAAGGITAAAMAEAANPENAAGEKPMHTEKPNIVYIMTDQQRFDTIAALGNDTIHTPNYDRLVRRGIAFTNAYSTCPVCVPARYTIRTGRQEPSIAMYQNMLQDPTPDQPEDMEERCGAFLARTLGGLGYRTFGVGKFHAAPWDQDLGYDVHYHSEEIFGSRDQLERDSYSAFIREKHPEYAFLEMPHGERTEMYYMPQMSPLPPELTVEAWAADRTVELIKRAGDGPFFSLTSFIGPHPPFAPPLPFNRMYHPDRMPDPVCGDLKIDHMDEQIPWMNEIIWAEHINAPWARILKARYYGEISYIDQCLGRILDAVEAREDADNTLICFFSDHGDHLGDHHAWQKESYFEQACHVPFLLSWPGRVPAGETREELVCLADLFGIATTAAGAQELRDGIDVLGMIQGKAAPREHLIGFYGNPGTPLFKMMVRKGDWKYIFMANGDQKQLFNLTEDPAESALFNESHPEVIEELHAIALNAADQANVNRALENGAFKTFPYRERKRSRIYQFCPAKGVRGFPEKPEDALDTFPLPWRKS